MRRVKWIVATGLLAIAASVQAEPPASSSFAIVGAGTPMAGGTVTLTQAPKGLLVRIEAEGLSPGWHAVHFHSVADCSDPGFKASGGHVHDAAAAGSVHGLLNPNETDLGDLPNIHAAADGRAAAEIFAPSVSLGSVEDRANLLDADGSALVIHASPDDHQSQPIGGAGARVACAAIK